MKRFTWITLFICLTVGAVAQKQSGIVRTIERPNQKSVGINGVTINIIEHPNAIVSGKGGKGCSAAVGYSVLNRSSDVDVGKLMLKYNGGGHKAVGTCQFTDENMETELPKMLDELCKMNNEK